MSESSLQTEFEFTLPQGYVDGDGTLHREGRMRLATAADEIEPLKDPRVQSNSSYLTIILLSRVITQLGDLESVNTTIVENLFVSDLEYLQDLYERINNQGSNTVATACPECGNEFEVAVETGTAAERSPMNSPTGMDAGREATPNTSPEGESGGGSGNRIE